MLGYNDDNEIYYHYNSQKTKRKCNETEEGDSIENFNSQKTNQQLVKKKMTQEQENHQECDVEGEEEEEDEREIVIYQPILAESLPLSWFGESIQKACLTSSKSLNSAAQKLLELLSEIGKIEEVIATTKQTINELDHQLFFTKFSTSKLLDMNLSPTKSCQLNLINVSTIRNNNHNHNKNKKNAYKQSIETILEEKVAKYQKIEELNFKLRIILQKKESVLRFLSDSVFELTQSKVIEELESFVYEREKKQKHY